MIEVRQTEHFSEWLNHLKDANAVAHITVRIRRMEMGNPGDSKSEAQIVILLRGGDKRTQQQDIKQAQELAETV